MHLTIIYQRFFLPKLQSALNRTPASFWLPLFPGVVAPSAATGTTIQKEYFMELHGIIKHKIVYFHLLLISGTNTNTLISCLHMLKLFHDS